MEHKTSQTVRQVLPWIVFMGKTVSIIPLTCWFSNCAPQISNISIIQELGGEAKFQSHSRHAESQALAQGPSPLDSRRPQVQAHLRAAVSSVPDRHNNPLAGGGSSLHFVKIASSVNLS